MNLPGGNSTLAVIEGKFPLLALLFLLFLPSPAHAEEDELRSLELYNGADVATVSIGRSPRPASQTAENITVVTAREIEALNAHNLADVLYTVAGVQIEEIRTPGTPLMFKLQGSKFNHVLVLIDNVPINNLADNFPDIGSIPVQMIERVEVVKGAASSSWGNALGGVVNVITKAPLMERPVAGMISASGGKASTLDGRAETTGTAKGVGYYLTGGKLRSDGLLPNNYTSLSHFYGKLHYNSASEGSFSLTTLLTDNSLGLLRTDPMPGPGGQLVTQDGRTDVSQLIGTASFMQPLSDRFSLEGMYRTRRIETDQTLVINPGGTLRVGNRNNEESNGAVVKLNYLDDLQRVVAGVDYDHLHDNRSMRVGPTETVVQRDLRTDNRVGVYLNDTFTLGKLAVTPSIRFDHTGINGSLYSPSFGVTYALTENTVLRGYTAKGYSLTTVIDSNALEQVWTSQVGFETADIPFLWLKGTLFRNDTWDIRVDHPETGTYTHESQLKQGYEVEVRTTPVLNTSISVGYTYVDAHKIADLTVPKDTLNLALKYEDKRQLRILLNGHYINWNDPSSGGRYDDFIWDLFLGKKVFYSDTVYVEFFGSLRNIFNSEQYLSSLYKNPGRWGEVGIRCGF